MNDQAVDTPEGIVGDIVSPVSFVSVDIATGHIRVPSVSLLYLVVDSGFYHSRSQVFWKVATQRGEVYRLKHRLPGRLTVNSGVKA